jgi:hypothetical protein
MPRKAPAHSLRPSKTPTEIPPPDDKQLLIREHAERRMTHPPGNIFGMYVGVAVCIILVLVGWIIALPRTLGSSAPSKPDAAIEAVRVNGAALGQSFSGDAANIERTKKATETLIETIKQQNEAAQK